MFGRFLDRSAGSAVQTFAVVAAAGVSMDGTKISDVTYTNLKGTGASPSFSPTIWGNSASNRVSNVTFTNVHLTVPGGSGARSLDPPSNQPNDYNPRSIGTRPAYGWYIRCASNIKFINSSVRFNANDNRPAVLVNNSTNAADWSVQQNLRTGVNQYGDRAFTLTVVPTAVAGAQWIRSANDSKAATANPLVQFTLQGVPEDVPGRGRDAGSERRQRQHVHGDRPVEPAMDGAGGVCRDTARPPPASDPADDQRD